MKLLSITILSLTLISCGQSDINLKDSEHKVITSGETLNKMVLELPFINQVHELCKDLYLRSDYATKKLYKQAVAQCTFDNISILNIGGLNSDNFTDAINELCKEPQYQNEPVCNSE